MRRSLPPLEKPLQHKRISITWPTATPPESRIGNKRKRAHRQTLLISQAFLSRCAMQPTADNERIEINDSAVCSPLGWGHLVVTIDRYAQGRHAALVYRASVKPLTTPGTMIDAAGGPSGYDRSMRAGAPSRPLMPRAGPPRAAQRGYSGTVLRAGAAL